MQQPWCRCVLSRLVVAGTTTVWTAVILCGSVSMCVWHTRPASLFVVVPAFCRLSEHQQSSDSNLKLSIISRV